MGKMHPVVNPLIRVWSRSNFIFTKERRQLKQERTKVIYIWTQIGISSEGLKCRYIDFIVFARRFSLIPWFILARLYEHFLYLFFFSQDFTVNSPIVECTDRKSRISSQHLLSPCVFGGGTSKNISCFLCEHLFPVSVPGWRWNNLVSGWSKPKPTNTLNPYSHAAICTVPKAEKDNWRKRRIAHAVCYWWDCISLSHNALLQGCLCYDNSHKSLWAPMSFACRYEYAASGNTLWNLDSVLGKRKRFVTVFNDVYTLSAKSHQQNMFIAANVALPALVFCLTITYLFRSFLWTETIFALID